MAEYAVVFTADASSAESSIKNLKKSIKGVTKEFENAEIGAGDFLAAASDLSQLQKELKDASSAVIDIDKAYGNLDKALAAMQKAYEKANKEAVSYHKDTLKIAEDSAKQEDRLLKQRMNAEREAFEERLKMAIAEDRRNERRLSARMEFRAGMGAKGAIPEVASPVRGSANIPGSPAHIEINTKELDEALATMQKAYENASKEAVSYHEDTIKLAEDSAKQEDRLLKQVMEAERKAFDERLAMGAAETRAEEKRFKARMEFRADMGARGAIPEVASPVRGSIDMPGSPAYLGAIGQAAKTAKEIKPDAKAFQANSLAFYENKLKTLQKEARLIHPDTNRWKELNKQILQAEKGIRKINQKQSLGASARDRVGAAGGAFLYGGGMGGGVGSAAGGIAGGLMGGVPGAFAGAAVGQAVDNLGTALAGITSQASAIQKIQRGLAMASVDAKDFAQAQAAVGEMSQKLLVPLEQTAKYFTQLRANTKEYNLSVDETRQILEGTVLAIMATGGSAEDLDGAMRAVVQIMSKGGVQAEELRGQLGERFPGAVVKFAQANKLSFEQLQDGLEKGTIGIREFINFAKKNYTDYAKFSEQLATAPEYAGQRLQIALEQVSLAVGSLFGPMGAEIQDGFTAALKGIAKFVKENRVILGQMIRDFGSIIVPILKVFVELLKILGSFAFEVAKVFTSLFEQIKKTVGMASIGAAKVRLDKAKAATAGKTREAPARQESVVDVLTGKTVFKEVKDLLGINSPFEELDAAQRQFNDMGGMAAYAQANNPVGPSNLTFGGAGAGMSIDRAGEEDKKKKKDSLENFERLRDQLANAYSQAEIERIKARYELEKRLREDLYDMQEFGANRLQRQNLQFLRALAKAEQDRRDVIFSGQLSVAGAEGRVAASPSSGGPVSSSGYIDKEVLRKWLASQGFGRTTGDFTNKGHATPNHTLNAMDMGILGGSDANALRQTIAMERKLKATGAFGSQLFGPERDPYGHGAGKGGQNIHLHIPTPGGKVPMTPGLAGLMNYSGPVSAGAPGKVGSNKSRDTMATANIGIERENAALADRGALLVKESTVLKELGRYMQEVYNVPDLTLDNKLLKERNDLIEQGVDENVIDYKMRLFEIDLQYKDLLKALPSFAEKANLSTEQRKALEAALAEGLKASKDAEKNKNDETLRGIEVAKKRENDKYIKDLQDEIKLLLIIGDAERRLAELTKENKGDKAQAQKVLDLEAIKKNIEETRALIGDFVSSTTSDYKGFLKAVISGEDAADALKQFQDGLKDKALTIFLDFAMAPVEKFLKEGLEGLLLPKAKNKAGELPKETTANPVEATNSNTNATVSNTQALVSLKATIDGAKDTSSSLSNETINQGFGTFGDADFGNMQLPSVSKMLENIDFEAAFEPVKANFAATLENLSSTLETNSYSLSESAVDYSANFKSVGDSANDMAKKAGEAADEAKDNGEKFKESLGKVASGIGIAAGTVMGIMAGMSQIKKGGTGNTLMGIGSILASVGGGIGGFMKLKGANGGTAAGGWKPFPVSAFANGGMVKGPTLGLVGEGKYNEAIVPLPDGRSIPVQMRGGPGGSGSSRDLLASQSQSRSSPSVLSMSFQSTTINGVEYVDRAQLEMAMAETRRVASRDGAARGANLAIDRLANSPSSRRRAGIR